MTDHTFFLQECYTTYQIDNIDQRNRIFLKSSYSNVQNILQYFDLINYCCCTISHFTLFFFNCKKPNFFAFHVTITDSTHNQIHNLIEKNILNNNTSFYSNLGSVSNSISLQFLISLWFFFISEKLFFFIFLFLCLFIHLL